MVFSRRAFKTCLILTSLCLVPCIVIERYVALRTIPLDVIAKNIPHSSFAVSFDYSRDVLRDMGSLADELGVLPHLNLLLGINDAPSTVGARQGIGARGFAVAEIDADVGGIFLRRADRLLSAYFNSIESLDDTFDDDSEFDEPDDTLVDEDEVEDEVSVVSGPLRDTIDSLWNAGFLTVGSAIQFDLTASQRLQLGLGLLSGGGDTFVKSAMVRTIPLKLQSYILHEVFKRTQFNVDTKMTTGRIHHGIVHVGADDLEDFTDIICPEKSLGWDACSSFEIDRDQFRASALSLVALLDDSFALDLDFYWTVRGTTLIWSNREAWIESALRPDSGNAPHDNALLQPAIASLPESRNAQSGNFFVSAGADLKALQQTGLKMLTLLRLGISREAYENTPLLASPEADEWLTAFEQETLLLPRNAGQVSFAVKSKPSDLNAELWIHAPESMAEDEPVEASNEEARELYISVVQKLLMPNRKFFNTVRLPLEDIVLGDRGGWTRVGSRISTPSLAPLVQRRMQRLSRESREIF